MTFLDRLRAGLTVNPPLGVNHLGLATNYFAARIGLSQRYATGLLAGSNVGSQRASIFPAD